MSDNQPGPRENPFAAGHDPRLVYEHDQRAEVVAGFRQALSACEPFILVTGEAGVGKTSIVTQVLTDEKAWSAFITNPALTRAELLEEICLRFGVDLPEAVSKPRLLAELERHLAEIRREDGAPVLVVDEAHNLSLELLEELRLLSNLEFKGRPLVQIVLVGLATLDARLSEPDLGQLRQRIGTHLRVRPFGGEDTWRYIHHRVTAAGGNAAEAFPDETCIEIHRLTRGVPRSINTLASHALQAAARDSEKIVTVKHVQASAAGTWLRGAAESPARPATSAAAPAPTATPPPAPKAPAERPRPKPGAPPVAGDKPASPRPVAAEKPATEEPIAPPAKESKPATKPAARPSAKPVPKGEPVAKTAEKPPQSEKPAPPPPAEPEPQAESLPPRSSGEPEVREWISRFVDPDNPIQIGVRAGADTAVFLQDERDPDAEFDVAAENLAMASSTGPKAPRKAGAPPPKGGRGRRDTTWITATAGGVVVLAALVVFVPRMKSTGGAPADSAAVVAMPSQEPTPEPKERPSRRRDRTRTGDQIRVSADTAAASRPRWQGIEVATYLDPYRASAESSRLSELTGLSTRVMEASDPDGDAYRVVLGSFSSRKKAERAADDLIRRGLIDQARVVPLHRKPSAQ